MAEYTKVKAAGYGPYLRSSGALVEAIKVDTVAATETPQLEIFPEYIRFYNVDESRYTATSILGLDADKKTKSLTQEEAQDILGDTGAGVVWETGTLASGGSDEEFLNDSSAYASIYQKTGILRILPLDPSGGMRDAWADVVVSAYPNSEGPICTLLGSKNAFAGTAVYSNFGSWYTTNALAYGLNIVVSSGPSGSSGIRIWWTDTSGSTNANLVLHLQVLGDF